MSKSNHIPITATELANLWATYQNKTMFLRFLEYFSNHTEFGQPAFQLHYERSVEEVEKIKTIFQEAEVVIPIGFTEQDVNKGTPKLYDHLFDIMFIRLLSQIGIAIYGLFTSMSYRKDIRDFFKQLTTQELELYDQMTEILLETGVITRPPVMTMPKEISFVHDTNYMRGFHLFKENRSLNVIELSLIQHAIDTNLVGMQLMIGFAQVTHNEEVRKHFVKGMELSKKIETELGDILRQSYIEPPATHAGKATDSKIAPFSDKMMMYCTSLLSTFGLGSNALGGAFSLRSDLPTKMVKLTLDIYSFAKDGGKLMIENGWMEEPPQIEDRNQLTKE